MIAVIFEVWPREGHRKEYLDIAGQLRAVLETMDGFVSVERFESLTEPGKLLRSPSGATRRPSGPGGTSRSTEARRRADARASLRTTGFGWPPSCATME